MYVLRSFDVPNVVVQLPDRVDQQKKTTQKLQKIETFQEMPCIRDIQLETAEILGNHWYQVRNQGPEGGTVFTTKKTILDDFSTCQDVFDHFFGSIDDLEVRAKVTSHPHDIYVSEYGRKSLMKIVEENLKSYESSNIWSCSVYSCEVEFECSTLRCIGTKAPTINQEINLMIVSSDNGVIEKNIHIWNTHLINSKRLVGILQSIYEAERGNLN